jgi:nucleotide-binding universal stress UspA family protein
VTTLEPLRFRRIMVPVDESKPSQNSLAVATGLARETGAQVILTHVVQMRWSQDELDMRATYGEIVDDYRASGEETLRRTARPSPGSTWTRSYSSGTTWPESVRWTP